MNLERRPWRSYLLALFLAWYNLGCLASQSLRKTGASSDLSTETLAPAPYTAPYPPCYTVRHAKEAGGGYVAKKIHDQSNLDAIVGFLVFAVFGLIVLWALHTFY